MWCFSQHKRRLGDGVKWAADQGQGTDWSHSGPSLSSPSGRCQRKVHRELSEHRSPMCELVMGSEQRVVDLGCRAKLVILHQGSCFVAVLFGFWCWGMKPRALMMLSKYSTPRAKPLFLKGVCHRRPQGCMRSLLGKRLRQREICWEAKRPPCQKHPQPSLH